MADEFVHLVKPMEYLPDGTLAPLVITDPGAAARVKAILDRRAGAFGEWTVDGPNLTADEIRSLPEGSEVEIVWSGGNGPHRYVVVHDLVGEPFAMPVREHERDPHGPMRYYNPLTWAIGGHPLTQVRRVP